MRLASVHLVALTVYVCVLFLGFAVILGVVPDKSTWLGFKIDFDPRLFGGATIYMMLIAPFAFVGMLIFFALLRAKVIAIVVLLVSSIAFSIAFLNHAAFLKFVVFLDQKDIPLLNNRDVALFRYWVSDGNGHLWIGIVWAGVTAALAHHLVYAALKPRVVKESVSHA